MKAHIEGSAWVQAIVGVDGRVERVRLVKSLDAVNGLDEEALKGGTAVDVQSRYTGRPACARAGHDGADVHAAKIAHYGLQSSPCRTAVPPVPDRRSTP